MRNLENFFVLTFFQNLETWKEKAETRKRELEDERTQKSNKDGGDDHDDEAEKEKQEKEKEEKEKEETEKEEDNAEVEGEKEEEESEEAMDKEEASQICLSNQVHSLVIIFGQACLLEHRKLSKQLPPCVNDYKE